MYKDVIDKLDSFSNIFDVDYFKAHRPEAYTQILLTKDGDEKEDDAVFAKDICRLASQKQCIPPKAIENYNSITRKTKRRNALKKNKVIRFVYNTFRHIKN